MRTEIVPEIEQFGFTMQLCVQEDADGIANSVDLTGNIQHSMEFLLFSNMEIYP